MKKQIILIICAIIIVAMLAFAFPASVYGDRWHSPTSVTVNDLKMSESIPIDANADELSDLLWDDNKDTGVEFLTGHTGTIYCTLEGPMDIEKTMVTGEGNADNGIIITKVVGIKEDNSEVTLWMNTQTYREEKVDIYCDHTWLDKVVAVRLSFKMQDDQAEPIIYEIAFLGDYEETNSIPGFELLTLIGAIGIAYLLLRRRK